MHFLSLSSSAFACNSFFFFSLFTLFDCISNHFLMYPAYLHNFSISFSHASLTAFSNCFYLFFSCTTSLFLLSSFLLQNRFILFVTEIYLLKHTLSFPQSLSSTFSCSVHVVFMLHLLSSLLCNQSIVGKH